MNTSWATDSTAQREANVTSDVLQPAPQYVPHDQIQDSVEGVHTHERCSTSTVTHLTCKMKPFQCAAQRKPNDFSKGQGTPDPRVPWTRLSALNVLLMSCIPHPAWEQRKEVAPQCETVACRTPIQNEHSRFLPSPSVSPFRSCHHHHHYG